MRSLITIAASILIALLGPGIASAAPPPNDDFVNAEGITQTPFSAFSDTAEAVTRGRRANPVVRLRTSAGTVWYAFTAPAAGSYRILAVERLPRASRCVSWRFSRGAQSARMPCLRPTADVSRRGWSDDVPPARRDLRRQRDRSAERRPRSAAARELRLLPGDPSSFENVQFYDQSYDPADVGIASATRDFGDGSTATGIGCCPQHRYLADGDYTAKLTVTTYDGRTASGSRTVTVRTHDVAIVKLGVPQSAVSGQTRSISVGVVNSRYAETVDVQLMKSTPQGWTQVGWSRQTVAVRASTRPTTFSFNYTFDRGRRDARKGELPRSRHDHGRRDALPTGPRRRQLLPGCGGARGGRTGRRCSLVCPDAPDAEPSLHREGPAATARSGHAPTRRGSRRRSARAGGPVRRARARDGRRANRAGARPLVGRYDPPTGARRLRRPEGRDSCHSEGHTRPLRPDAGTALKMERPSPISLE